MPIKVFNTRTFVHCDNKWRILTWTIRLSKWEWLSTGLKVGDLHELWMLKFLSDMITHHKQLFWLRQYINVGNHSNSEKSCDLLHCLKMGRGVSVSQKTRLQCKTNVSNHGSGRMTNAGVTQSLSSSFWTYRFQAFGLYIWLSLKC